MATAALASAPQSQQIPLPEIPGGRLQIEQGSHSTDPAERVTAARDAASASLGRLLVDTPASSMAMGDVTLAIVAGRFSGDPQFVHGWLAVGSGTALCHMILPNDPQALSAMRPAMDRCHAALQSLPAPTAPAPAANRAATPAANAPAQPAGNLAQALEQVPPANRPVAIVLRSSTSFMGGMVMPTTQPWMLFANGWATDCTAWDPAVTPPEPAALEPLRCSMARWRKGADGYAFAEDDGSWDKAAPSNLTPFRPGQTVEVDLVNKSGAGTAVGAPGLAVSSLTSGMLRMTAAGRIEVGSWTAVTVSGANVGGGSSRSRGPAAGSYHLDGHLIAIADAQGGIRRGFIAEDRGTGGPYIYLNGDLFWPRRGR
ncbi:hypothetical protein [Croceibacterium xixiisoli]|nr:hypothetical protein [Croceibacterium xixiisoli]